ncbi:RDD family protein [Clostridium lundense]|uniref:RDD family protein n=1 Tax=Clostridium lundense TaxID=319475 RepID=UPI000485B38E|nr:RDD family protein [Clostridium lundense]
MSEENHEIINEKVENDTITEENLESIEEKPQIVEEKATEKENIKEEEKKISFNDSFMASLIDTMVMAGISLAGLLILDKVILKILGYKVIDEYRGTMLLVVFVIVTLLYPAIMESKNGNTIGKKSSKLKVEKVEK